MVLLDSDSEKEAQPKEIPTPKARISRVTRQRQNSDPLLEPPLPSTSQNRLHFTQGNPLAHTAARGIDSYTAVSKPTAPMFNSSRSADLPIPPRRTH